VYLALILLTKPLEKVFDKIMPSVFSKLLAPSIVAFLASLPIMLDNFSSVSLFTFAFNIFIIPIISVVYSALFILSIISLIVKWLSFLLIIVDLLLGALIFIVSKMNTAIFMLSGIKFSL
jgi:hypothetical protein